jgi:hypothetical protein
MLVTQLAPNSLTFDEGPTYVPSSITILSIVVVAIDVTPLVGTMINVIGDE